MLQWLVIGEWSSSRPRGPLFFGRALSVPQGCADRTRVSDEHAVQLCTEL